MKLFVCSYLIALSQQRPKSISETGAANRVRLSDPLGRRVALSDTWRLLVLNKRMTAESLIHANIRLRLANTTSCTHGL